MKYHQREASEITFPGDMRRGVRGHVWKMQCIGVKKLWNSCGGGAGSKPMGKIIFYILEGSNIRKNQIFRRKSFLCFRTQPKILPELSSSSTSWKKFIKTPELSFLKHSLRHFIQSSKKENNQATNGAAQSIFIKLLCTKSFLSKKEVRRLFGYP